MHRAPNCPLLPQRITPSSSRSRVRRQVNECPRLSGPHLCSSVHSASSQHQIPAAGGTGTFSECPRHVQ
ncbi:hypothetical protein NDU88_003660 [Pleurodeles waltl]|uniref:Uncharacterized protein n=1 Tax=Pleurodeles waltl TaxID=8319 RepID=A0AAV7SGJ7_PLEWA|nr:hypothetical protein NDU88_003660 [Pleurodeles waltl]